MKLKINFKYFQFDGKMWAIIETIFVQKEKEMRLQKRAIGKECHRQLTIINNYATFVEMHRVGGKKKKKSFAMRIKQENPWWEMEMEQVAKLFKIHSCYVVHY